MRHRLALLAFIAALPLNACVLKVHKLDIQQGNVVTQEMVDKLRPGMTRAQVRYVLGTPLVTDSFHQDRWDYFYSYKKGAAGAPILRAAKARIRRSTSSSPACIGSSTQSASTACLGTPA